MSGDALDVMPPKLLKGSKLLFLCTAIFNDNRQSSSKLHR